MPDLPFLARVPSLDTQHGKDRLRRHTELISQIINSLVSRGNLILVGPGDWALVASVNDTITLTGDATGAGNSTIDVTNIGLQGFPVSSDTPAVNDALVWDGSEWEPSLITEDSLSFSDTTTADATASKHGLLPKLPSDSTTFLNGDGVFSTPPTGSETVTAGAYASLPTDGHSGNLYLATDYPALLIDNGSSWYVLGKPEQWTPPDLTNFAWINQGSGYAVSVSGGAAVFTGAQTTVSMYVKTIPTNTNYSITARMELLGPGAIAAVWGICISDGTKLVALYFGDNGSTFLNCDKYNSTSSFNGNYRATNVNRFPIVPTWLRITDDGTTRKFYVSTNGVEWVLYTSNLHADFLTPADYGFFYSAGSTTLPYTGICYSLVLT